LDYVSTRAEAPVLKFRDCLLAGLARDGGLYLPQAWPVFDEATLQEFAGKPYSHVAKRVLWPFVEGEIEKSAFEQMVDEAYGEFAHKAVAPLVQLAPGHFVLELFHGPTLAFKDVAMQLLARLMDHVLAERQAKATIVGATSGDTGGAAIEAFRGRENTDIFILFPNGKVSDVQRRQMTTVCDANVHSLAIDGDFDACQSLVKGMFNHTDFRDRVRLSGVNSINFARVMAQIVYYFTAAVSLGAPQRPVSFSVPTGNFGDILAGWAAKRMGLPIDDLVIATNRNDILVRALHTGRYETMGTTPTISPSMDIQVSSNFERALYEANGRDGSEIRRQMESLKQSGSFTLSQNQLNHIRTDFSAFACDEDTTARQIAITLEQSSYLLDPHTAIGVAAALERAKSDVPMVTLGTAHPAKFPKAVAAASGVDPELPKHLHDLHDREEQFHVLPNDQTAVEAFIGENTRAAA